MTGAIFISDDLVQMKSGRTSLCGKYKLMDTTLFTSRRSLIPKSEEKTMFVLAQTFNTIFKTLVTFARGRPKEVIKIMMVLNAC